MPKDAATDWLRENAPLKVKRKQPKRRRMVAVDPLDLLAFERLRQMETSTAKSRRGRGRFNKNKYLKLPVRAFLEDHLDFDGLECLLLPGMVPGQMPSVDGSPASRVMCSLKHGGAGQEWVARHLCGNGHIGCVNPTHLTWGTTLQNARDRELHRLVPVYWPELSDEEVEAIAEDKRHINIVAVDWGVHSAVVREIRNA